MSVRHIESRNAEPEREFEYHKNLRDKNKTPVVIRVNSSFTYFTDKKEVNNEIIYDKMTEFFKQFNEEFEKKFHCFLAIYNLKAESIENISSNFFKDF